MGVIQKLPPEVVNRMAAGEVLVRPSDAIKELVENSLDAKATEVAVTLRNGGMSFLQVVDNGKGISRDDLELVCERFATSKLRSFEDLLQMKTYGFRGEALASLSQVSKVAIVSKPKDQECAYSGQYSDGKMTSSKPSAGRNGTCVSATDMFYNIPSRKKSMTNSTEESSRVSDVIIRFAIHRPDVSFSLRQMSSSDFRTSGDGDFRKVVGLLLGKEISDSIQDIGMESQKLKISLHGCMARPIAAATAKLHQDKKSRQKFFSLFINGRSVTCTELKHGIDEIFSSRSLICRFMALSLKLDESRVDVNVHPTKKSVMFLEQDEVIGAIVEHIGGIVTEMFDESAMDPLNQTADQSLGASQSQRNESLGSLTVAASSSFHAKTTSTRKDFTGTFNEKKRVDYMEVRTDGRERRIDEFLTQDLNVKKRVSSIALADSFTEETGGDQNKVIDDLRTPRTEDVDAEVSMVSVASSVSSTFPTDGEDDEIELETENTLKRTFDFDSLRVLREEICQRGSTTMRELFKTFTFVGIVNSQCIIVQYGTSLYLLDFGIVLKEFFYQTAIFSFGNYGSYKMAGEYPRIIDLLKVLADFPQLDPTEDAKDFSIFAQESKRLEAESLLGNHPEMLHDYFSIGLEWRIDENAEKRLHLVSLPSLVHYFVPQLEGLAHFIGNLVLEVDFDTEKDCFEGICHAISDFFVLRHEYLDQDCISSFSTTRWTSLIKQILVPLIKKKLIPPESFKDKKAIRQLANSHDLYKVFERCNT
ncbi:unnamed protein product [Caenorhabditis auriculariae]|uniref:DNA mismatch repair protein S5 domain-containing protein n=1 Tax=Caenorhabditis auriculariae TaxID=2777116 RepID=A0A8S1GWR3_9PELO|nr:unnamed protein product [Caenorhabditis auriculariae]